MIEYDVYGDIEKVVEAIADTVREQGLEPDIDSIRRDILARRDVQRNVLMCVEDVGFGAAMGWVFMALDFMISCVDDEDVPKAIDMLRAYVSFVEERVIPTPEKRTLM